MKNILKNIGFPAVTLIPALLSLIISCGEEKAGREDCRAVCRMIQQCEPQAYVTEERLAACYDGCDKGSIYLKDDYSVCVVESSGCEDFDACLLAVDNGGYDDENSSGD